MPPKPPAEPTPGASSSTEEAPAAAAAAQPTAAGDPTHTEDTEEAGCPICQFIEAGPCGDRHKVWVSCRSDAKEQDVDFVQHCADNFRAFFGCMLSHQEYYQPFLEATGVDVDKSQEAIDATKAKGQQQQQQQPQENGGQQPPPQQPPQHQQQQGLISKDAGSRSRSRSSSSKTGSS